MARPSSKIMLTPAQKEDAKSSFKAAMVLAKAPLDLSTAAVKEAQKAHDLFVKTNAAALKTLVKTLDAAKAKADKATAAFAKGKAKIDAQVAALDPVEPVAA